MNKKLLILSIFLLFISLIQSCTLAPKNDHKKIVVTTIFPLYDFTKQITQDKMEIIMILPPGVEVHSFEPKPRSIFDIRRADLFIYTGNFLEIWASNIIKVLDNEKVVNSSKGIDFLEDDDEHNHEHLHTIDPHIWIDPQNVLIIIDNILEALIRIDPENHTFYETNAKNYQQKIKELDEAYYDLFSKTKYKTIIYAGHFVFGYLTKRYNIGYITPYKGFSADTLPTPKNIQNLINLINTSGQKTIFYEEMINPKVAKVIAEETQVKMLPLNGAGSISKADFEKDITYLDLMYQNIENLKKGLEYRE